MLSDLYFPPSQAPSPFPASHVHFREGKAAPNPRLPREEARSGRSKQKWAGQAGFFRRRVQCAALTRTDIRPRFRRRRGSAASLGNLGALSPSSGPRVGLASASATPAVSGASPRRGCGRAGRGPRAWRPGAGGGSRAAWVSRAPASRPP